MSTYTKPQEPLPLTSDQIEEIRMGYQFMSESLSVDLDEEVPQPPIALSYGTHSYETRRGGKVTEPTSIGTDGNFSFIQAPPKSYKSYFVSMLVSAYLNSGTRWAPEMKSDRKGRDVVHFDTEQGKFHALKGFRRTADMAETQDGYKPYSLRTIGYKDRMGFIEYVLKEADEGSIGLVVIDGIADLVSDVNNIVEANECVQKLMEWSSNYNIHIITVIHSNYGSDKPTGHLGSFCEKKTECQISLEKDEETGKIVTVKCKRSRNKPFDEFRFALNELNFPEIIEDDIPSEYNF